jgi:uncharacterized membrane protein
VNWAWFLGYLRGADVIAAYGAVALRGRAAQRQGFN